MARSLVEAGLAACVNVVPGLTSFYLWEGALAEDGESLLVIKTTAAAVPALEEALADLHPYDVPEILSLPVDHGADAYVRWVTGSVGKGTAE